RPNERFSQEIILTVDDRYLTLSNGTKVASKKNPDGTRTDHWRQDKPHAPYLAMIAVGDFHEELDEWNNVPLHYIVEKSYAPHSKKIFDHTPEMLSFFSDKLNYKYPWDKYAQVVVRDFVSGAMENTGAVVFGDFIQKTERELIDNHNDEIVAHEMMHHWFGDLVTCEDWSNLTLNEGFANYAEYLWLEHKYGKDNADFHRMNEMNGYYYQVFDGGAHPLVHYYYDNREDMFDAHSYNKGGLVLHMLRSYVGDEAFFASLNKYLTDHANTAVEVDELRMAFEDTVGEDLNWFFNQWFLGSGHPYLDVTYTYNDLNKVLLVEVDQTNTPEGFYPLFRLPVDIAIYFDDGTVEYHPVVINEKKQRILIEDLKAKPATYVLDGKNVLLAMINENKTAEEYKAQFNFSDHLMDKITAFTSTGESNDDLLDKAFQDKFYNIRMMAIGTISDSLIGDYTNQLQDMAMSDPHSEVRREALMKLLENEDFDPLPLCRTMLLTEKAYPVLQVLIEVVATSDPSKSQQIISRFMKEDSDYLTTTIAGIMVEESIENIQFMESKAKSIATIHIFDFYEVYQAFLKGKSIPTLERSIQLMNTIGAKKDGNMFRKYLAVMTLLKISEDLSERVDVDVSLQNQIRSIVRNIAANETNPMLIEKYQGLK
ncbi:MAG: M1 family metallopeptidase, partial [Saprospiraceae bacterium]